MTLVPTGATESPPSHFPDNDIRQLRINARYLDIIKVTVQDLEATFVLKDPFKQLVDEVRLLSRFTYSSNMKTAAPTDATSYFTYYRAASDVSDAGELVVNIPRNISIHKGREINVIVHYTVTEAPLGLQYILADPYRSSTFTHAYTDNSAGYELVLMNCQSGLNLRAARAWMPCFDNPTALTLWELLYTVHSSSLTVASSGEFVTSAQVGNTFKFQYFLNSPTAASNIAFAVGPFQVHLSLRAHSQSVHGKLTVTSQSQEGEVGAKGSLAHSAAFLLPSLNASGAVAPPSTVSVQLVSYCAPGRKEDLKQTVAALQPLYEAIHSMLALPLPYPQIRIVFVEGNLRLMTGCCGAGIVILSYLHNEENIDQVYTTRPLLAHSLAYQWFGSSVSTTNWADTWLLSSCRGYIVTSIIQKFFGSNALQWNAELWREFVCSHPDNQPVYAPNFAHPVELASRLLELKGVLVFQQAEARIGTEPLQRVLAAMATPPSSSKLGIDPAKRLVVAGPAPISTWIFLKRITKLTGHKLGVWADDWIFSTSFPHLEVGFTYDHAKNQVELGIHQQLWFNQRRSPDPQPPMTLPLTIRLVELEPGATAQTRSRKLPSVTSYDHSVTMDTTTQLHVFACHNRAPTRPGGDLPKVRAEHDDESDSGGRSDAEEINLARVGADVPAYIASTDSPIQWIRVDTPHRLPLLLTIKQPEYMWRNQLLLDRDVTAQLRALRNIARIAQPMPTTVSAIVRVLLDKKQFYRVRMNAAVTLAYISKRDHMRDSASRFIDVCRNFFFETVQREPDHLPSILNLSHSNEPEQVVVCRWNDFSDLSVYFVQKALVYSLSLVRDFSSGFNSHETLRIILLLLHSNDNSKNAYEDAYYLAALLRGIGNLHPNTKNSNDMRIFWHILDELKRYLTLNMISTRCNDVILIACLESIAQLQFRSLLPYDPEPFIKLLTTRSASSFVRLCAARCLISSGLDADSTMPEQHRYVCETLFTILEARPSQVQAYLKTQILQMFLVSPLRILDQGGEYSWDIEPAISRLRLPVTSAQAERDRSKVIQRRLRSLRDASPWAGALKRRLWLLLNFGVLVPEAQLVAAHIFHHLWTPNSSNLRVLKRLPPLPTAPPEIIAKDQQLEHHRRKMKEQSKKLSTSKRNRNRSRPQTPSSVPTVSSSRFVSTPSVTASSTTSLVINTPTPSSSRNIKREFAQRVLEPSGTASRDASMFEESTTDAGTNVSSRGRRQKRHRPPSTGSSVVTAEAQPTHRRKRQRLQERPILDRPSWTSEADFSIVVRPLYFVDEASLKSTSKSGPKIPVVIDFT